MSFDDAFVAAAKEKLPELPAAKKARFIGDYKLPSYDAGVLTAESALADFYEETVKLAKDPKITSNWVMGELMRLLNENAQDITECKVTSKALASLINMLH